MTKKEFGRCIAFCLVVCTILCLMCGLFKQQSSRYIEKRYFTYRNLNQNTVDAVFIGTSGVDRYWCAPKAYDEYGTTLYTLASDAMPTWLYTSVIEEAYVYQNPELILVDMRAYGQSNTKASTVDVRARRVLDAMDFFSANRIKTAFKTMEFMHENFEDEPRFNLSYLLPYIKYHTMWKDEDYLIANHVGDLSDAYLSFFMKASASVKRSPIDNVVYDSDLYAELDPATEASLYELLDYAEANDIELLFVDTPHIKDKTEMGRSNALIKILEEKGANYINYCETDADGNFIKVPGLDNKADFYNDGHVNYYGAEKFTEALSAYLEEHYDLPDRREDPAVQEQWDGVYTKLKKRIASWEKK